MKTLLFTLLACFISTLSLAQEDMISLDHLKEVPDENPEIGVAYRIVGIQNYTASSGVWEISDSSSLHYSGERGSDLLTSEINFDERINYDWDGTIHVISYRDLQEFDEDNNLTLFINQDYDGATWENDYRNVYENDSEGNTTLLMNQDYNAGAWENDYRYVYTIEDGLQTLSLYQKWNGSDWENINRVAYTYDFNGNNTQELRQNWDGSDWVNVSRYIREYDVNGNETLEIYQSWDGSDWENQDRDIATYDGDGWIETVVTQDWDGSDWINDDRELYTHEDGDYYYSEYLSQDYVQGAWENNLLQELAFTTFNRIKEIETYYWDGTIWEKSYKVDLYYEEYEDGNVAVSSPEGIGVQALPNPASDYVLFRNKNSAEQIHIHIFNTRGQLIKELSGSGTVKWHTRGQVPTGIYTYRIKVGEESASGQLIIQ